MSLEIRSVSKTYGSHRAVDDVSFTVTPGRIFGFLGTNGAGKTTTMRMILDIIRPDSGSIFQDGTSNTSISRNAFGYLPEERGLYPKMRVDEQMLFLAQLYGATRHEASARFDEWMERLEITENRERLVEQLSKGNQQKVQFIAAILHEPDVLLMDEPFTGLDPVNLALLREAFVELRDEGRTIGFSTHQMGAAEALCESLAIVDQGRVVASGTLGELKRGSRSRTVRLAAEGETIPSWLGEMRGVATVRPGASFAELELLPGAEPRDVLAAVLARGTLVTRFEVAEPSQEAIFIGHVGRRPDEEPTLDAAEADAA